MRTAIGVPASSCYWAPHALAADSSASTICRRRRIDDIVQKFAAKETQFAKAREVYTYRQTARIQELEDSGAITGRWETTSRTSYSKAPTVNARSTWCARRYLPSTTSR